MTTNQHNEAHYENTLIALFQDLGYAYECGYDVERDYRNPYYEEDLREALRRQDPVLSAEVLNEAFRLVTHVNEGTLEQRNEFAEKYFNMKPNDWRRLIRDYVRDVTERQDLQDDELFRFSMAG